MSPEVGVSPEEFREGFLTLMVGHANANLTPFAAVEDDGTLTVMSFAVGPDVVLHRVRARVRQLQSQTWALALDRFTQPGQGTTRGSVLTWLIVWEGVPCYGIQEYDGEGDDIEADPVRTDCTFWNDKMALIHDYITNGLPPREWM